MECWIVLRISRRFGLQPERDELDIRLYSEIKKVVSDSVFLTSLLISLETDLSLQIRPKIGLALRCFRMEMTWQ